SIYFPETYRSIRENPRFRTHFLTLNPTILMPDAPQSPRCTNFPIFAKAKRRFPSSAFDGGEIWCPGNAQSFLTTSIGRR
ncbi:hypothetical protein NUI01_09620, partial [Corynebacterium sp. MC-17D]|uniref:hypothetical protein n=1 Tax=Corynebacterium lipophilum TaxID=2804918 RepID=UPI0022A8D479